MLCYLSNPAMFFFITAAESVWGGYFLHYALPQNIAAAINCGVLPIYAARGLVSVLRSH